jgi:hypothetical protein
MLRPNCKLVLQPYEDKVPTTYSWSFTLSHRLPGATVLEASYVGNSSSHQIFCTNCGRNLNAIPEGAMFGFPKGDNPNNYRPFAQYYGFIGHQPLTRPAATLSPGRGAGGEGRAG